MQVEIVKDQSFDRILIRWPGGQSVETRFPKKGPIPHDAVHYIVEQELSLTEGFWGMVASGMAPGMVQERAKTGGHASAKRREPPATDIVELIQAERLVECFEAEAWGEPGDTDTLRCVAAAACDHSFVATPDLPDPVIAAIRTRIQTLKIEWLALPIGQSLIFDWPA